MPEECSYMPVICGGVGLYDIHQKFQLMLTGEERICHMSTNTGEKTPISVFVNFTIISCCLFFFVSEVDFFS